MGTEPLDRLAADGYAPWSIPGPNDRAIADLVSGVSTVQDYERINADLALASARILTAYAERCASLAVRTTDRSQVGLGVTAALLAAGVEDDREILIVLSLLFRAAELIGSDPFAEFDDAMRCLGPHAVELAQGFVGSGPSERSISAMGFVESRDDKGFRFRSQW